MTTKAQRRMRLAHYREGVTQGLVPPELARNTNTNYASDVYWAASCALDPGLEARLREGLVRPLGLSRTSSLFPITVQNGMSSQARARLTGQPTFQGLPHSVCGTTTRYTASKGCVRCSRQRTVAARERIRCLRDEREERIYSARQKRIDDRTARMLQAFDRQRKALEKTNG